MTNDYILVNWDNIIDPTDNESMPGCRWLRVTHCKDGWLEEREDGIERFRPYLSPREFDVAQAISEGYDQYGAAKLLRIGRPLVQKIFDEVKRKIRCVLQKK